MSCSSRNILPLGRSVSMATRDYDVPRGGPPLFDVLSHTNVRVAQDAMVKMRKKSTNWPKNRDKRTELDRQRASRHSLVGYEWVRGGTTARRTLTCERARRIHERVRATRDDSRSSTRTHVNAAGSGERTCVSSGRGFPLPRNRESTTACRWRGHD